MFDETRESLTPAQVQGTNRFGAVRFGRDRSLNQLGPSRCDARMASERIADPVNVYKTMENRHFSLGNSRHFYGHFQ